MESIQEMLLNAYERENYIQTRENRSIRGGWVIAAVVPAVMLTLVYILCEIAPFGSRLLLCEQNRLWFEHFERFRGAMTGSGSVFYSFSGGLGGETFSNYREGFFGPLPVLTALLTETGLPECLAIMTIARSAMAGMFAYILFYQLSDESSLASIALSSGYAAGSLFTLSFLAPQFSDAPVTLPLIALGVSLLSARGSVMPMCFGLIIFLLTTPSLWPLMAIFTVVFFVFCNLATEQKDVAQRTGLLIFSIAIAIGVDAIVLIPSLVSDIERGQVLYSPAAVDHSSVGTLITAMLGGAVNGADVCQPLIFCSSLPLLLAPVYLSCRRLSLGERQTAGFFSFFVILSIVVPPLAAVWLCFSAPTGAVVGFGSVLALTAAAMSARLCGADGGIKTGRILLVWMLILIMFTISAIFKRGGFTIESWLFAVAFLTLTAAVSMAALAGRRQKAGIYVILLFIVCLDCVIGGYVTLGGTLDANSAYTTQSYISEDIRKSTIRGLAQGRESSRNIPYRLRGANIDEMLCIDAPCNRTISNRQLFEAMGIKDGEGYTPVTDSLFGVRYIVLDHEDLDYELLGLNNGNYVHFNEHSLPLAFAAGKSVMGLDTYSVDPFMSQNMLVSAIAGAERELFVPSQISLQEGHGCQISRTTTGEEIIRSGETAYVEFRVVIPTDGTLYMYLKETGGRTENVAVNGSQIGSMRLDCINSLGSFARGEEVTVYISVTDDRLAVSGVWFATMAEALTDAALSEIAQGRTACAVSGNTLTVSTTLEENQLLMTSIPWQSGWRVTVDGKDCETLCAAGSFLAVNAGAGKHTVAFEYAPSDFEGALVFTLLSAAICFIFMMLAENARRKKENMLAEKAHYEELEQMEQYQQPEPYDAYGNYTPYPMEYEPQPEPRDEYNADVIPELVADDEYAQPDEYGYYDDDTSVYGERYQ